ncbi:YraN family protein [Streptomyces sioyaensis]|uniref:YraN family protein n=1 Tax=Streptomyces sioyaensis TaxID=67364 RepID=UPI0037B412FE
MNAMHAGRRAGKDTQLDPWPRELQRGRARDGRRGRSGPPPAAARGSGSGAAGGGTGSAVSASRMPGRRGKGGVAPAGREPSAGVRTANEAAADPAVGSHGGLGPAATRVGDPGPVVTPADDTGPAATPADDSGPAAPSPGAHGPAAVPTTAQPPDTCPATAASTGTRRRALGRYGEDLAARRLTEAGMRILDRNWRCREGEIDIVAADGDALVVCEVKTRRAGWYEHPMAAVRPEKTARLRLLAERWLERHGGPPPGGVRIDVIGILLPARGAPVVQHARGVA